MASSDVHGASIIKSEPANLVREWQSYAERRQSLQQHQQQETSRVREAQCPERRQFCRIGLELRSICKRLQSRQSVTAAQRGALLLSVSKADRALSVSTGKQLGDQGGSGTSAAGPVIMQLRMQMM